MCDKYRTNTFPRGEGAPVRTLGRKRNGEMLSAGKSLNKKQFDTIPPEFLFSHRLTAATASPREKRWALPRQCVSNTNLSFHIMR